MRIRVVWFVVVSLFLPAAAHAHGHTWDFFGGPAFAQGSLLVGWHQTIAINSPRPTNKIVSLVFDLTNLKGKHEGEDVTQLSYQGGVRVAINRGAEHHLASAHALLGTVHRQQGAVDDTDLAFTYGGSYEGIFGLHTENGWAARVQVDHTLKDSRNFVRFSVGVVRRFK